MSNGIQYKLKLSKRARHMRLEVRRDGQLVVTVPFGLDFKFIENFVNEKSSWIAGRLKYFDNEKNKVFLGGGKKEYKRYKEQARLLVENRISYYTKIYNFKINRVSIKNTKSRWGSCSKKGNLNFNYKIALLSKELADYVVVHELCHLKEFNHSQNFWKLVSLALPDYRELRNRFRK